MTHFYESMIMWSDDGLQLKSYANDHPDGFVIAKPKYIPRHKIDCSGFQERNIHGSDVRRFDYWAVDEKRLKSYIDDFRKAYPDYMYDSPLHKTWFMGVPRNKIAKLPNPKDGVKRILAMKGSEMDDYMKRAHGFLSLVLESGLKASDLGVTNSTLLGTYTYGRSDIDIIVFGKDNYWKYINFIQNAKHPWLRWKSLEEWKKYFASYNAGLFISEDEFIWHSRRKFIDVYFGETVVSVFGVENPDELSVKWGDEKYTPMGMATVKGKVKDDYNGVVRPGYYELENARVIQGPDVNVKKVVTYARDFMLQAFKGESIVAAGILEKVTPLKSGEEYYRIVIGYFESYTTRRGEEYIKVQR
ncbi:hypothetical protein HYT53_02680 [Candidatus Woesearchaeota archaeon]|nr:hypothetical protein [Candidatus Woesearchaeota archaeon]